MGCRPSLLPFFHGISLNAVCVGRCNGQRKPVSRYKFQRQSYAHSRPTTRQKMTAERMVDTFPLASTLHRSSRATLDRVNNLAVIPADAKYVLSTVEGDSLRRRKLLPDLPEATEGGTGRLTDVSLLRVPLCSTFRGQRCFPQQQTDWRRSGRSLHDSPRLCTTTHEFFAETFDTNTRSSQLA